MTPPKRGPSTPDRILAAALVLFRKKGFEGTTMRDIAGAAGMSLGAAYYYFPSKEALVLAYYERENDAHERRARATFAKTDDLRERILAVYRVRLEMMRPDRRFLSGLFRVVADPTSPASIFSQETSPLRTRGVRLAREAISVPGVPDDARDALALALWSLGMGLVLYFVHDESKRQEKTFALVDGAVDLVVPLVPLLSLPQAQFFREQVMQVLARAGLDLRAD